MFDLDKIPSSTPVDWAKATNTAIARLRARKVDRIDFEEPTQLGFCCRWIEIYIQAHNRRALSLRGVGFNRAATAAHPSLQYRELVMQLASRLARQRSNWRVFFWDCADHFRRFIVGSAGLGGRFFGFLWLKCPRAGSGIR